MKKVYELLEYILKKKLNFSNFNNEFKDFFNNFKKIQEKFINKKSNENIKLLIENIYNSIFLNNEKSSNLDKISNNDLENIINKIKIKSIFETDNLNCMLQIKSGAGGEEAGIFANEIFEIYKNFIISKKYDYEIISKSSFNSASNSIREITVKINNKNSFDLLKNESGVHRIQRIPITEKSDRIHTSTIAVSIIPFLEEKDININISRSDLKIESCRSSGAGGQHVNTTNSAVRITHIPTNIVINIQNQRSYHDNLEFGLNMIKTKVFEYLINNQIEKIDDIKKKQLKNIERNEKIRTYNFVRHQIIDHRFNDYKINFSNFFQSNINNMLEDFSLIIKIYYIIDFIKSNNK